MKFDRFVLMFLMAVLPGVFFPGSTAFEMAKFLVLGWAIGALLLGLAWQIWQQHALAPPTPRQMITWLPLLLVVLISATGAANVSLTIRTALLLAAWLIVVWIASSRVTKATQLTWLLGSMTMGAVIPSLYGLAQIHGWAPSAASTGVPVGVSTFGNENQMAGFAALAFWPALALRLLARRAPVRVAACVGASILLVAVAQAEATGPKIALAGAALFVVPGLILSKRGPRGLSSWFVGGIVAVAAAATAALFCYGLGLAGETKHALPALGKNLLLGNHGEIRRTDWLIAWQIFRDNIAGFGGAGNYQVMWPEIRAALTTMPGQAELAEHIPLATRAHNDYLQGLAELGLPGFFSLAGIAATLLWRLRSRLQPSEGQRFPLVWLTMIGAIYTTAIHALVSFPLHLPAPSIHLAVVIGVLGAPVFHSASRPLTWRPLPRFAALVPFLVGLAVIFPGSREFVGDIHAARGQNAFAVRQMPTALSELEAAHGQMIWPTQSDLYLGLVLTAYNRDDEALALLTTSLKHHPTYEAMLALAEMETARRDYEAALLLLDRVDNCRPTENFRQESQFLRGMLFVQQEHFAQADKIFATMLTKYPDNIRALLAHGYLFVRVGDIESARQRYQHALGVIDHSLRREQEAASKARLTEMKKSALTALASLRH